MRLEDGSASTLCGLANCGLIEYPVNHGQLANTMIFQGNIRLGRGYPSYCSRGTGRHSEECALNGGE